MKICIKVRSILIFALLLMSLGVDAKRIKLCKNIIDGKCVLEQSMFNIKADEYVVRYHYDLMGDTITLPEGARLVFKASGSVAHGALIGQKSSITSYTKNMLFNDIEISGKWRVDKIYSRWFDFGENASLNTRNFQNMCSLTDDGFPGTLYISEGDYPVEVKNGCISCMNPNSNTDIILDGNLLLQPNNLGRYCVIEISNKHNIKLSGNGSVVGDVNNHIGTEGEWGMGVSIKASSDIEIKNLTIKNCWGDCIYLGQSKIDKKDYSENVRINNVICEAGRRQGLSLIAGKNIQIKNSKFINTGKIKYTAPGRGIDIEPNDKDNTVVQDILIEDCSFTGNYNNNDFLTNNLNRNASIKVLRCKMDGNVSLYQNSYNVVIDSCVIRSLDFVNTVISDNVVKNTVFRSVKPNISAPEKVRFENCEYPKNKDIGLSSTPFARQIVFFTAVFLFVMYRVKRKDKRDKVNS